MTVYIAGKMNGLPDKGRKAFEEAETELKANGFTVLNPACLPDGLPDDRYMPTCLTMVDTANILVLLPGWIYSPGAMLEKAFAEYQGKMVFELDSLKKCMDEWQKLLASTWKRTHGNYPCQTLPGFIRNRCAFVENPAVNISYVEQLKKKVKQLAVERDAAVEDLKIASRCNVCKNYLCKETEEPCYSCLTFCDVDNFEWRGVKEE